MSIFEMNAKNPKMHVDENKNSITKPFLFLKLEKITPTKHWWNCNTKECHNMQNKSWTTRNKIFIL